jgi:hypothetical protein
MDTLWVYGTLQAALGNSPWGTSGYRLTVTRTAPYQMPRGR